MYANSCTRPFPPISTNWPKISDRQEKEIKDVVKQRCRHVAALEKTQIFCQLSGLILCFFGEEVILVYTIYILYAYLIT